MMTFEQVVKEYFQEGVEVYEVLMKSKALEYLESKSSATWGSGPIKGTGWTYLARVSPNRKGENSAAFICKDDLIR